MPVCVSQVLCHLVERHLSIYASRGHQLVGFSSFFYEVKVVISQSH